MTGTDIRPSSAPRGIWLGVFRGLISVFGICSIAWAVFSITVNHAEAAFAGVSWSILRGDSFSPARLSELKQQLDSTPADRLRPVSLVDVAVIRLKLLEIKMTEGAAWRVSAEYNDVEAAFVAALSKNPNSALLWSADYWVGRARGDATDRGVKLLRMSYETGPNEAWIAQRRNPVALENFSSLPQDLAEHALSEFARLVQSGLYRDAASILAGPGWPVRQLLLNRLAPLDESERYAMARELNYKQLDGVSVPGISDERPSRPF